MTVRDGDKPPVLGAHPDATLRRVRRVELDHRVLAGASSRLEGAEWQRLLRDSGVARVPVEGVARPGSEGLVTDAAAARQLAEELAGLPEAKVSELRVVAGIVAILALSGTLVSAGYVGLGLAVLLVLFSLPGMQRRALEVAAASQVGVQLKLQRQLHERVRSLAGRSFVTLVGDDTVVVNTPHLTFLHARIDDVDRAWGRQLDRDRALVRLRDQMVASNRALGREEEDAEVRAIDAERARIEAQEDDFRALHQALEDRLHQARENVEYLAEVSNRQALSSQLGEVLVEGRDDSLAELAASLEVEVAVVVGERGGLEVALGDADAALRAILEVEAVVRGQ